MASAYAALVSLSHIIQQIKNHEFDQPPIQVDKKLFECLSENVNFLQHFLENYSHIGIGCDETECLTAQITSAAYTAEDIIETHIVDQILDGYKDINLLCKSIEKVIQDMSLIKKGVMRFKEKVRIENQYMPKISTHVTSSKPLPLPHSMKNTIVGCDDAVTEIMDRISGDQTNRQILPIVGMGGIGKTTLAKKVYDHPIIVQKFDVYAWVTVSQEYSVREMILGVLSCQKDGSINKDEMCQKSEDELGNQLYQSLYGRRYFIVMDDMWSIESWEKVMLHFPDNNNGSRILVTTRLRNVAVHFSADSYEMDFLDEEESWNLFCKEAFAQEDCPLHLEEIGRNIAKRCNGLPLSIVVVGGLLAKSEKTLEYWDYVEENLNSIVNIEDGQHCLKILSLSYHHLPIHLKPCFLYMGIFPEDNTICVSSLIKLWVAEGFLKPISFKSLEVVAEEYLMDLIDRNMILVHKFGSRGRVKFCKIHDLLRDLCLREAGKERFLSATSVHSINNIEGVRRICIHQSKSEDKSSLDQFHRALQSAPLARSLICDHNEILTSLPFRLLRVLKMIGNYSYDPNRRDVMNSSVESIFQLVNYRYLAFRRAWNSNSLFPSSIAQFWNLQSLIIEPWDYQAVLPSEIWEMRQFRHLEADGFFLPDPPPSDSKDSVLTNLQTIKIVGFKCSEEVVKRIPNIKRIKISYDYSTYNYHLTNLNRLHKLESLSCFFCSDRVHDLLQNLDFPRSLKKLNLQGSRLFSEDMTVIGSLPNLEVLKLRYNAFVGPKWIPSEGEFLRLKYLEIFDCDDLEYWMADSTHFPCLEKLILVKLKRLKEIPLDIGEIPTLRVIKLGLCRDSVVVSAMKILEEQENAGNGGWIRLII